MKKELSMSVSANGSDRRIQQFPNLPQVILETLNAGLGMLGPRVKAFEEAIKVNWGVHAVTTSSGTAALFLSLKVAGIQPGDEVIVPALTFASTSFAVNSIGAVPVFVDVEPWTYTLDPECVEAAITEKTRAIIVVHLYGQMANMRALQEISQKYHLTLIEDAAQAHGARYQGQYAGSLGDFGCFSLWYGKNMGGLGDGGLVTTHHFQAKERLRRLRNLGRDAGIANRYEHEEWGIRSRMHEIDAAVCLWQLSQLERWNQRRRELAHRYTEAFASLPVASPYIAPERVPVYYKYALLAASPEAREQLEGYLNRHGVETERIYPILVPNLKAYQQGLAHRKERLAVSEDILARLLCLPLYPELTEEELEYVIATLRRFYM